VAGRLARNLGTINGYAEGVDGAVFVAGMISLALYETDPKTIVRRAARLIHPSSPYRQCLDLVIALGDKGRSAKEVFQAVEDRWHIEYPATNNAVANGGIVAASVWFGEGDLLKTLNLAFGAADFTDADCNAANAGSVVGAMRGMNGLPGHLVAPLHDRISGSEMGGVKLTPPVEEKISAVASRIAAVGRKILTENGAKWEGETFTVTKLAVRTQEAQRFELADLTEYWNKEWTLDRAGFGGAGGGMAGVRGITYLDGDALSTWPRDEVRGVALRRKAKLGDHPKLALEVGADGGRAWQLEIYANNTRLVSKLIEGGGENEPRRWEKIEADLGAMRGQEVELRLYQRVLVRNKMAGNAYWRKLELH
jgi:hypothetical protein